jgi:hypothetical protein
MVWVLQGILIASAACVLVLAVVGLIADRAGRPTRPSARRRLPSVREIPGPAPARYVYGRQRAVRYAGPVAFSGDLAGGPRKPTTGER